MTGVECAVAMKNAYALAVGLAIGMSYAREGKEIERKSRTIEVYDIRIRQFLPPDRVEIDVDCSKGTYIRRIYFLNNFTGIISGKFTAVVVKTKRHSFC